jgi:hypothetical protein
VLELVGVVAVGYVYGWLTGLLPSPSDPQVFWVSNLAAPYAVLPFLAGARLAVAAHPAKLARSVTAGALAGAAAVAGFYRLHAVGRDPHADIGVPETVAGAYVRWLSTFVLGRPGGIPWLTLAVVVGVLAGALGWVWITRGALAAGLLGVAALLLEPLGHVVAMVPDTRLVREYPALPENLVIWVGEALLGLAAVWWVHRRESGEPGVTDRLT